MEWKMSFHLFTPPNNVFPQSEKMFFSWEDLKYTQKACFYLTKTILLSAEATFNMKIQLMYKCMHTH